MLSGTIHPVQLWAANWARRRQGKDNPQGITLRRRRIYILPTRFGMIFGCLVFAMLLGSLNYAASLGFALTFLLAGLGLVMMHHCHNNLLAMQLRCVGTPAVFASQRAQFRIALTNESTAARYELELTRRNKGAGPVDLEPRQSKTLILDLPAEQRGWLALERFAVTTRHPGNLYRAWTWVHMDIRCLVYPEPAAPGRPLPMSSAGHGSRPTRDPGDEDFAGLRPAVVGDPLGRIAWKAYARSGELLLKEFASGDEQPSTLDWDSLPELDCEARLSQLTRWCLDAAAELRSFGLRLPGTTIALGNGEHHLHECLKALALFNPPGQR